MLPLCLGAAALLWATDRLSLRIQRQQLDEIVALSADRLAETVRRATHDVMLRNDAERIHLVVENIGAQEGVTRVRVYNKEGRVRASSVHAEEGLVVSTGSAECVACHGSSKPRAGLERKDRIRILPGVGQERTLGIITPIYNEPACTACHVHPASQRVLGVLDVQISMSQADAVFRTSERRMSYGLAAMVVGVVLLTIGLLWALVLRPVRRLTRAMEAAAEGDLTVRVPVSSSDEMGEMAEVWNGMTDELQRAQGELEGMNRTLEQRVDEKTRQLEHTHRQMVVVEKMASLGKLAAVVAHEINNPLAGIRTYARLLRRQFAAGAAAPPSPEQAKETDRILQMVDGEAGRCGDIVRNLLAFSRQAGARLAEEDLSPVVERCRMLLKHQAEMLGVTLETRVEPDLPKVVCDAAQVQQVILALAMNALEATPSDGRVSIEASREGDGVRLAVSDTGWGITKDHLDRIFEPFFTTKEAGKGVGLGLAVVYGIVNSHHGRIDVESEPGRGTTFTVRLPARQPEAVAPADGGPGLVGD